MCLDWIKKKRKKKKEREGGGKRKRRKKEEASEKRARRLIIYYLAGCAPKKQDPPSSRRRQRWRKEKNEERVSSVAEKIQRRGRPFRPGPLREISRAARIHTYARTYVHARASRAARANTHTFLPACSRVQIGIEKSRSQLKLLAQRIRRDKIPIISCPHRRPPSPALFFPCPVDAADGIVGGGGGVSLARTQFH